MSSPYDIERHAQFQHGLVTDLQLATGGASRRNRRTLVQKGIVVPVNRGTHRALGAAQTWRQELLAACLAAGPDAVASHRAAALLWDLIDGPAPVEISLPYARRSLPVRAIRHRTQALRMADRAIRNGIPVTTPARTLLDLGAVDASSVPRALERCLFHRLLTTEALWRILQDLGGPGRRGAGCLRKALDQRALGDSSPHSMLEVVMADVLATTGVRFVYQFPVVLDGHRYYLDFAVPVLSLACEADGLSAHGTREALNRDLERQNRLVSHGWTILRYTHTQLTRGRARVRAEVVDAIRQQERRVRSTSRL